MTNEKTYTINTVPSLTWNWLKSNNDSLTVNAVFSSLDGTYTKLPQGVTLEKQTPVSTSGVPKSATLNIPDRKYGDKPKSAQNARITTSAKEANEQLNALIESTVAAPQYFKISGNVNEPLVLTFSPSAASISAHTIQAMPDSQATVIFLYSGNFSDTSFIQTKILAEENSKLHIIKVQLFEGNATQMDDTQIIQGDNSKVTFTQVELGGLHIASGLHTTLQGFKATFNSNVAYLGKNNQNFDFNHIVYHYGKKTECDMQVKGTIKDNAIKTYRGTIDFKNGCSGSKGNEMEETLILSPLTVNNSLPVILCNEDDVEGEHGATIGRLSADVLFYMQSRGIDEKQAEQIMSRAKIQAIADTIPDEKTRQQIADFLDKD